MASSTIGSTATNTIDHNLRTIAINSRGECNKCILKLGEVMTPAGVGHGDQKSMVESDTNANTRQLHVKESKQTQQQYGQEMDHQTINLTHHRKETTSDGVSKQQAPHKIRQEKCTSSASNKSLFILFVH